MPSEQENRVRRRPLAEASDHIAGDFAGKDPPCMRHDPSHHRTGGARDAGSGELLDRTPAIRIRSRIPASRKISASPGHRLLQNTHCLALRLRSAPLRTTPERLPSLRDPIPSKGPTARGRGPSRGARKTKSIIPDSCRVGQDEILHNPTLSSTLL